MRILLCFLVALCGGCANTQSVFSSVPSLAAFSQEFSLDHTVTYTDLNTNKTQTLITHLEINRNSTAFIGLGPLGGTLFECKQSVQNINCKSISQAIPAEMFFADMQLIYWPLEILRNNLKPNYTLEDHKLTRHLYKDNNLFTAIDYSSQNKWDADVELKNALRAYSLYIHPLHAKVDR